MGVFNCEKEGQYIVGIGGNGIGNGRFIGIVQVSKGVSSKNKEYIVKIGVF